MVAFKVGGYAIGAGGALASEDGVMVTHDADISCFLRTRHTPQTHRATSTQEEAHEHSFRNIEWFGYGLNSRKPAGPTRGRQHARRKQTE